jgi:hypothetical protein
MENYHFGTYSLNKCFDPRISFDPHNSLRPSDFLWLKVKINFDHFDHFGGQN